MNRVTMFFLCLSIYGMSHSLYHPGLYTYEPPMITNLKMRRRILKNNDWLKLDILMKEIVSDHACSIGRKTITISRLLELGVKPTEKHQWFAYLELYERTLDDSKRKLTLLRLCTNRKLPLLPPEIIRYIVSFNTHNEEPLIPRHLCTECKMIKK